MIDRLPPHSLEAERAFLGACLIDPEAFNAGIDLSLKPDDFYRLDHNRIWAVILRLTDNRRPVDVVTVREALDSAGWVSEVPASFLSDLARASAISLNAPHYARIVKDHAVRRGLLAAAGRIAELGYEEGTDVESLMDRAETALRGARDAAPGPRRNADPSDIMARLEGQKVSGIPTRFPYLNAISAGLIPGHLWIVGGFSSTGKSAFAVNLVDDIVRAHGTAMLASTEMSQEQYMLRLLSLTSGVPQRLIRHGGMTWEQRAEYDLAKTAWSTAKLRIFDDLYNTTRIRRAAKRMKDTIGLDVLVVDFIQNLNESGDEIKDARIAAIELQMAAKELGCTVIALSQLSNAMAQQQNAEGIGNYYSFKGSGAIRDAADFSMILDRDRQNRPDVMWIHVVKNRHDELGKVAAWFDLPTGRLTQMTAEEQHAIDPNSGRKSRKASDD